MRGMEPLDITIGELIDRATIVRLKSFHIKKNKDKYEEELSKIIDSIIKAFHPGEKIDGLRDVMRGFMNLMMANMKVWVLEDILRYDRDTISDKKVADTANLIDAANDLRSKFKREVDSAFAVGTETSDKVFIIPEKDGKQQEKVFDV